MRDDSSRDNITIEEVKELLKESEARFEARIEARIEAWVEARVEARVQARTEANALLWAPTTLEVVASQLLLFCLAAQPKASRQSKRFWNARNNANVHQAAMILKTSTWEFCNRADSVINRQNSGVHYQDVSTLKQAIYQVIDLIKRYP